MLAVPLVLLYELALIAIWFTERRQARGTESALVPASDDRES